MKTLASVTIIRDPVFAEVCTGKGINRPDNRCFFQVAKQRALSTTAVSAGGILHRSVNIKRGNSFSEK
ncbi:hypothetical protein CGZ11_11815 [Salmonella enterica]|uniref:Uncharacterized protein n=1 Tax=Salmonella enterica TaxID=28901 RepID=A0A3J8T700_SALER|nr:hypothetical protein [Salmonella enterica]EAU5130903.1 hypothetical protein [Salmonella enterica subsp. enterica serovar Oranienburg]ECD9477127.1 hypothetical protein [Salmonella enterica subsp. houtenae]EAO3204402.1 hypothetical protein [Salmonella enterica]EAX0785469.1 hypothetical protein [Salmonella enterica]